MIKFLILIWVSSAALFSNNINIYFSENQKGTLIQFNKIIDFFKGKKEYQFSIPLKTKNGLRIQSESGISPLSIEFSYNNLSKDELLKDFFGKPIFIKDNNEFKNAVLVAINPLIIESEYKFKQVKFEDLYFESDSANEVKMEKVNSTNILLTASSNETSRSTVKVNFVTDDIKALQDNVIELKENKKYDYKSYLNVYNNSIYDLQNVNVFYLANKENSPLLQNYTSIKQKTSININNSPSLIFENFKVSKIASSKKIKKNKNYQFLAMEKRDLEFSITNKITSKKPENSSADIIRQKFNKYIKVKGIEELGNVGEVSIYEKGIFLLKSKIKNSIIPLNTGNNVFYSEIIVGQDTDYTTIKYTFNNNSKYSKVVNFSIPDSDIYNKFEVIDNPNNIFIHNILNSIEIMLPGHTEQTFTLKFFN